GRESYREYLSFLSEDEKARKKLGFEKMCRGWAKGSKEFKKAVLEDLEDQEFGLVVEAEAREMREPRWERDLKQGLECLGRTETELSTARKGATWKVALARYLRERHLVPNPWLAERLFMGTPNSLSSLISRHRCANVKSDKSWKKLQNQKYVD
ncbi:MAG: transposase, partial [Opitutales bacterium]|nr:transposase [Opitutales bacterium]